MPELSLSLIIIVRVFPDGLELAEALGFPELSCVGQTPAHWRRGLRSKVRELLKDEEGGNPLHMHRRQVGAGAEAAMISFALEPVVRRADWQEPVQVRFHYVQWSEGELHHAYIPALTAQVFATRVDLLPQRVEEHARLLLLQGRRRLSLADLAELQTVQAVRLETISFSVSVETPRERREAEYGKKETPSVLAAVATKLSGTTLPPAYEIEPLLQKLADLLGAAHPRSVLLVGPSGVGKTALLRELARSRALHGFAHTPFWTTSGARLIAGQSGYGMWQERCRDLCREAAKTGAIVHFGNLSELNEVGKITRSEQSIAGFLRPSIARGEFLAVAECTPEQLSIIERVDPHLASAWQVMPVPEAAPEVTRRVLAASLRDAPGPTVTKVKQTDAALDWLYRLHRRYATYSANPGRPLRFLNSLLADCFPDKNLHADDVTAAFTRETGLPAVLLDDKQPLPLGETEAWFARRVIGQPAAAQRVIDLLATIKAQLSRPRQPLASLLFIGPTGTGKTELAKALAEFLFGDAGRLVRFDLSEFSDPWGVQRLIGSGAKEGLLTGRIREQPFSVVLLDEFEKADPSFFDLLLQVLGDGRLTDGVGRVADFCNTVIVMTSNLGAQSFQRGVPGFQSERSEQESGEHFDSAVRGFLRPEIYNRIDAIVPFHPLGPETVREITERQLELLRHRDGLRLRPVECSFAPGTADLLARRGYEPRYGARPLRRAIDRELLLPLAEALTQRDETIPLQATVAPDGERLSVETRQLLPEARENFEGTVFDVIRERRKIQWLQRCRTMQGFENETTLLNSLTRRVERSKHTRPEDLARLERLQGCRALINAAGTLAGRALALEGEVLSDFYARDPIIATEVMPKVDELRSERNKLTRDILRRSLDYPDGVVMAAFSENREWLLQIVKAYLNVSTQFGGALRAIDYFIPPPKRTATSEPERLPVKDLKKLLAEPPEHLLGVVFDLRGPFFWPHFRDEAGLHTLKVKNAEQVCLVQVVNSGFDKYEPPARIDRAGTIAGMGVSHCRGYPSEYVEPVITRMVDQSLIASLAALLS